MKISDTSTGHGIVVEEEQDDSSELRAVALRLMPRWLELFAAKNTDYGSGAAFELGIRGQYSDIHRKVLKLKRAMWDGAELKYEGTEEIILDLISHLFLTIHMMEIKEETEREFVYNIEDAAVDNFFRTVGGDTHKALRMASALIPPFGDMVRQRAIAMQDQDEAESVARINGDEPHSLEDGHGDKVYTGRPRKPVPDLDLDMTPEDREKIKSHLRKTHGPDLEEQVSEIVSDVKRAWAVVSPYLTAATGKVNGFDSPEFAEADAAQYGVGFYPPVEGRAAYEATESRYEGDAPDLAKPRPPRILTETVNGRTIYYRQNDLGDDIEPLVLVPKAYIDQLAHDDMVEGAERSAQIKRLQDEANNQS